MENPHLATILARAQTVDECRSTGYTYFSAVIEDMSARDQPLDKERIGAMIRQIDAASATLPFVANARWERLHLDGGV